MNFSDYLIVKGPGRDGTCNPSTNGLSLAINANSETECIIPVKIGPGS